MPTILMFKKTGGYHNALTHEVKAMEKDGWEIVNKDPEPIEDFDYAISKEGWKRVVKVCDSEEAALAYIDKKFGSMDGVTIEERPRK